MESYIEGESGWGSSTTHVSTDEASQALAVLEADQVAIRTAAALPRWYLLVASFCMGIIVLVFGIPEAWLWVGVIGIGLVDVVIIVLYMWKIRKKPVRLDMWALFTPRRKGLIPVIGGFVIGFLIILTAAYFHGLAPWWMFVCGGVVEAVLMYAVASHAWKSWARTRP